MTHSLQLPYDSEVAAMSRVLEKLNHMSGQRMNPQDFVDRARDMFRQIGFLVDVKVWTTGVAERKGGIEKVEEVPDLYTFEIELVDRVNPHEFDHDRMAHEVQHNLLDLKDQQDPVTSDKLDSLVAKHTKGCAH